MPIGWLNIQSLRTRSFICGNCGIQVASEKGWNSHLISDSGSVTTDNYWQIYICHSCGKPVFFDHESNQTPGILFGPNIQGLSKEIQDAYDEARRCMSVNAYTAAELICRKILMYIAVDVDESAKEGDTFASYIDHLKRKGYVTPPMEDWVKKIKDNANDATHELPPSSKERAEGTLWFTAELLRLTYEMKYLATKYGSQSINDKTQEENKRTD